MNGKLDHAWLLTHLPHQGAMNLLESVLAWDATTLHARATNHAAPTHPLRRDGVLPAIAAVEYGAQAAAAHGALASGAASGDGMIASVRNVTTHVTRLDDVHGALDIRVEQLGGGAGGVVYRFAVSAGERPLVQGRVAVAFSR
ncbi:MAG TPA: 3-hydroxylacyl-ACP dehydratase [Usitatibacter sp.]|nr:3-hydroxylacyl-ACP dehydratase [Usitatibacter sp.]